MKGALQNIYCKRELLGLIGLKVTYRKKRIPLRCCAQIFEVNFLVGSILLTFPKVITAVSLSLSDAYLDSTAVHGSALGTI